MTDEPTTAQHKSALQHSEPIRLCFILFPQLSRCSLVSHSTKTLSHSSLLYLVCSFPLSSCCGDFRCLLLRATMTGVAQQIISALPSAFTVVQCPWWHPEGWEVPHDLVDKQPHESDSFSQPAPYPESWLPLLTRTLQNEDGHFQDLRYCVDVLVAAYRAQQAKESCEFYSELKKRCRSRHQLDQTRLGITALATMTQDSDRRAVLTTYLSSTPLPFQWQWITYHAIPRRLFETANSSHLSSFINSCLGLNAMRNHQGLALADVRALASEWFGNKRWPLHLTAPPVPIMATSIAPLPLAVSAHLLPTSIPVLANPLPLLCGGSPPTPIVAASGDVPISSSSASDGTKPSGVDNQEAGKKDSGERDDTTEESDEEGEEDETKAVAMSDCLRGFEVCAKELDSTSTCRERGLGNDSLVRKKVGLNGSNRKRGRSQHCRGSTDIGAIEETECQKPRRRPCQLEQLAAAVLEEEQHISAPVDEAYDTFNSIVLKCRLNEAATRECLYSVKQGYQHADNKLWHPLFMWVQQELVKGTHLLEDTLWRMYRHMAVLERQTITMVDLCCGTSAFSLAATFSDRGATSMSLRSRPLPSHLLPPIQTVLHVDMDADAIALTQHNFPGHDVRRCNLMKVADMSTIPRATVVTCGIPCQSSSRYNLHAVGILPDNPVYALVKLANSTSRPRVFVLECVKSLAFGKCLPSLLKLLKLFSAAGYERGYAEKKYVFLNTRHWISQNRDRIYIALFEREEDRQRWRPPHPPTQPPVPFHLAGVLQSPEELVDHPSWLDERTESHLHPTDPQQQQDIRETGIMYCRDRRNTRQNFLWAENKPGISFCVLRGWQTTSNRPVVLDGGRWRYLTGRECARLQGIPDSYTFPPLIAYPGGRLNQENHICGLMGNAVSVPVATAMLTAVWRAMDVAPRVEAVADNTEEESEGESENSKEDDGDSSLSEEGEGSSDEMDNWGLIERDAAVDEL